MPGCGSGRHVSEGTLFLSCNRTTAIEIDHNNFGLFLGQYFSTVSRNFRHFSAAPATSSQLGWILAGFKHNNFNFLAWFFSLTAPSYGHNM
jgi:hypothetical protein